MTTDEVRELIPEILRSCHGYAQWREAELVRLAASNGTSRERESGELFAQWVLVLESVEVESARAVLGGILRGDLEVPPYGQLPGFIRRESRNFSPRRGREPVAYGDEPRFRCLACRDSGITEVINPAWIRQHVAEIEAGLSRTWFSEARRWCREHTAGPFMATVVCDCEHQVAVRQRERIAKKESTARRAVFARRSMFAVHSRTLTVLADELREWIASYDPQAAFEWTPEPEGYQYHPYKD